MKARACAVTRLRVLRSGGSVADVETPGALMGEAGLEAMAPAYARP